MPYGCVTWCIAILAGLQRSWLDTPGSRCAKNQALTLSHANSTRCHCAGLEMCATGANHVGCANGQGPCMLYMHMRASGLHVELKLQYDLEMGLATLRHTCDATNVDCKAAHCHASCRVLGSESELVQTLFARACVRTRLKCNIRVSIGPCSRCLCAITHRRRPPRGSPRILAILSTSRYMG